MNKKTIALGTDDFKQVVEGNHYLIDKSLFIKEAISESSPVVLLPRPRRWGKTLNMTMLKYFFEKTEQSNRHLFNSLVIEQYLDIMEHQGTYPFIFLTLKDAKKLNWASCYEVLQEVILFEYKRHDYLLKSDKIDALEKKEIQSIITKKGSQGDFERALLKLCFYLHKHYNHEPIVLIDEYDAPIISGFENGYYQEIIDFTL